MTKKVKWGILGCGNIAKAFAKDLKFVKNAQLIAVGSRSFDKAEKFAAQLGVETAFGSYEELAKYESLDIIYVATPHPMHFENTMLCLENNKAVLCEKAFTINATEAIEMVNTARKKKLFLMEAMWARFIPATLKAKQLLKDGVIGEVKNFSADFGIKFDFDSEHRAFNPELGGGALLDLGVYPISYASMVFNRQPKEIASVVNIGSTGVDFNESISFKYESRAVASISAGLEAWTPIEAVISGTKGRIEVASPFFHSRKIALMVNEQAEVIDLDYEGHGLRFQAEHASQCLLEGKIESDIMPLDESIAIMQTMDTIRKQWNLVYPQEK